MVGWGESKKEGGRYWIARHSCGTHWGDEGFFRIRRGRNTLRIDASAAPRPGPESLSTFLLTAKMDSKERGCCGFVRSKFRGSCGWRLVRMSGCIEETGEPAAADWQCHAGCRADAATACAACPLDSHSLSTFCSSLLYSHSLTHTHTHTHKCTQSHTSTKSTCDPLSGI